MYSARLRQLMKVEEDKISSLFQEAESVLKSILRDSLANKHFLAPNPTAKHFEEARFCHGAPNLEKKIKLIARWKAGEEVKIPSLDFNVSD